MNGRSSIGPYLIEGLLGAGGIGQVYAALDQDLGRRVALKALRPEYSEDPNLLERFRNEAASLARLSHPNITMLYSLFRQAEAERQSVFMVMEIVNGETIEALLHRLGRISVRGCLAIMAQAALGLSYAHAAGIIHRDIKPSNLMLDEAGLLKITDFGIARVQGSQRLTRHGTLVGTLSYIAPEQIKGHEADERSDLYSLACVLYEMLSGEKPFSATTEYELIRAQLETTPRPLTDTLPELEAGLAEAIGRALAKDPADRFASVAEFAQTIGATATTQSAAAVVQTEVLAPALSLADVAPVKVQPIAAVDTSMTAFIERFSPATTQMTGSVDRAPPPRPPHGAGWRGAVAGLCALLALGASATAYFARGSRGDAVIANHGPAPAQDKAGAGTPAPPSGVTLPAAPAQPAPAAAPPEPPANAAPPSVDMAQAVPAQGGGPPDPAMSGEQPELPPTHGADDTSGHDTSANDTVGDDRPAALAGTVATYSPDGWPMLGGVAVHLEGVAALAPGAAKPVAGWIAAHGNYLACTPTGHGIYRCLTQQNIDLSQAILLNGAARTSPDALPLYRDAEAHARSAKRGLWR